MPDPAITDTSPAIVLATPRKLPKASSLQGRVVVLDIAFAAEGTGTSFEKVTEPFIRTLGARLRAWVDHHDHHFHARFANDPRFVLAKKSEHGACPEMVTPAVVARIGEADTIVCHNDLDGLYAAAKWIRAGIEPYPGADDDARAVDTRIGSTSELGSRVDQALRARPKDDAFRVKLVRFLASGAQDAAARTEITRVASEFRVQEQHAMELARRYVVKGGAAVVDATGFVGSAGPYDKTLLLLEGQKLARAAVVYDEQTVTLAAAFDSGIDFLKLLGISGGMPTRVSVPRQRLDEVLAMVNKL